MRFSDAEHRRRVARTRELMRRERLDILVLWVSEDVTWISSFFTYGHPFQAVVVTADGADDAGRDPLLFTRLLEANNLDADGWGAGIRLVHYDDDRDEKEQFADVIVSEAKHSPHCVRKVASSSPSDGSAVVLRVGWERHCHRVTGSEQDHLRALLLQREPLHFWRASEPMADGRDVGFEFVDTTRLLEEVRLVKSDEELARMRAAARVTGEAVGAIADLIERHPSDRPPTENWVAARAVSRLVTGDPNCRWPSYMPFVACGPASSRGHVSFEGRPLVPGNVVFVELSGCVLGYHAPVMRTFYVARSCDEPLPDWLREAESLICEAVETIKRELRPGARCCDVDASARRVLDRRSFPATCKGMTGYTVGAGQRPDWSDGSWRLNGANQSLVPLGATFHAIPWLQTPWGAVGLSATLLVGADETVELDTGFPRRVKRVRLGHRIVCHGPSSPRS